MTAVLRAGSRRDQGRAEDTSAPLQAATRESTDGPEGLSSSMRASLSGRSSFTNAGHAAWWKYGERDSSHRTPLLAGFLLGRSPSHLADPFRCLDRTASTVRGIPWLERQTGRPVRRTSIPFRTRDHRPAGSQSPPDKSLTRPPTHSFHLECQVQFGSCVALLGGASSKRPRLPLTS